MHWSSPFCSGNEHVLGYKSHFQLKVTKVMMEMMDTRDVCDAEVNGEKIDMDGVHP